MRILAISDLHGWLPPIKVEADVLLVAGDILPDDYSGQHLTHSMQGWWLRNEFSDWLDMAPVKHRVYVAGNHDFYFMNNPGIAQDMPGHYLQGDTITIDGVKIHGSPWAAKFGSWAFMKNEDGLYTEWEKIPHDTDVLITHGPPKGFGDKVGVSEYVGSQTLRDKVTSLENLKLHVFGHIHEGYGKYDFFGKMFANVSHVSPKFQPKNNAMFFEV